MKTPKQTFDWQTECTYIELRTSAILGHADFESPTEALANFNGDKQCFIRYCIMQRDSATREGFDDSAQYIQHCIDDLTGEEE